MSDRLSPWFSSIEATRSTVDESPSNCSSRTASAPTVSLTALLLEIAPDWELLPGKVGGANHAARSRAATIPRRGGSLGISSKRRHGSVRRLDDRRSRVLLVARQCLKEGTRRRRESRRERDTATRSHREDRRSAQPSARRTRLLRRMAKQRHLRVTQHRERSRHSQRNHQRHRGDLRGHVPLYAQPRRQPTHLRDPRDDRWTRRRARSRHRR